MRGQFVQAGPATPTPMPIARYAARRSFTTSPSTAAACSSTSSARPGQSIRAQITDHRPHRGRRLSAPKGGGSPTVRRRERLVLPGTVASDGRKRAGSRSLVWPCTSSRSGAWPSDSPQGDCRIHAAAELRERASIRFPSDV